MVFLAILVGLVAGVAALSNLAAVTAHVISQHGDALTAGMLFAYVAVDAVCGMFVAVVSGLVTLWLIVRLVRGPGAVGFSMPAECTGVAAWAYSSWTFYGRGHQVGLRVLGVEIAIEGQLA